ncbi:outer membrane beta-barrel domain-containing protein [Biformimicrobium ophioploci]|uniref:Outer membrane protein beta-barrel domain-containing protein n=1 Tax=Biformimicrobium ophioploci TaxID=3036711 RepID=A0ABQ6M137_9GAMM|nr:outer membrane beta-barrel domain-containing protein [Microbulbifer sp. NKW57]GMG88078.1 hypothetical protein MNKW57_23990 [Microbulbifer sp. NKW57]
METGNRRLFLAAAGFLTTLLAPAAFADDTIEDIIAPDIERREIREANIDSENFEVSLLGGIMNIEDFGSNGVTSLSINYHLSEDFFVEAAYGMTDMAESSYERLSGSAPLMTDEERELSYYSASLGYNFLPGEFFAGSDYAFNSTFYLLGGVGNTLFANEKHFTFNLGAGLRLLPTDWISVRLEFRDHIFEHDLFGETIRTNNLSAQLGASIYF